MNNNLGGDLLIATILRNIGKVMMGDKEIALILIDKSNYSKKYILICNLNINENLFDFNFEEYDKNKLIKYLPATKSGNSANNSPYIKLNINSIKKNEKNKLINVNKILNMSVLENNISSDFVTWFKENNEVFIDKLFEYYKNKFCKEKKGKYEIDNKKEAPTALVFKFFINNSYKYPGEIPEFLEVLVKNNKPSKMVKNICHTCGKYKDTIPTEKIKTDVFETFSLDQPSMVLGLIDKYSNQFHICEDCFYYIKLGKQIMDENLSFDAYSIKTNSKNTIKVKHSILPTLYNDETLKIAIKKIISSHEKFENNRQNLRNELEKLNNDLKIIEKKSKNNLIEEIRKEIRKINEKITMHGNHIDIRHIMEIMKNNKISYLDFYYYIDYSNKTKKILLDTMFINYTKIDKILENIVKVEKKINFNANKPYKFYFYKLFDTFKPQHAMQIQASLFNDQKIDIKHIAKSANENIYDNFMNKIFSNNKGDDQLYKHVNNKKNVSLQLLTFKFITELLASINVLE